MLGALAISRVRRNVVLLFFFSAGLTVASLLVRELVRAPDRTPLVVLSATYEAPFDINPWAAENLKQLGRLHQRNVSIVQPDAFGRTLDAATVTGWLRKVPQTHEDVPLVLYVNMHAAVNEAGQPCLVPGKTASLIDFDEWVPVRSILKPLVDAVPERPVVLCFESARQVGLARKLTRADEFATEVERLLASEEFASSSICAIGVSGSPAFNDWTGRGDCFTRILSDAMSGKADGCLSQLQNGLVSLPELTHYVRANLNEWNANAFASKRELWHFETQGLKRLESTVQLAWCIDSVGAIDRVDALPTPAEKARLSKYWGQLEELANLRPWERFPGHWTSLTAEVVAFESSVFGGDAVRNDSRYEKRLQDHLAWLKRQLNDAGSGDKIKQTHAAFRSAWSSMANDPSLFNAQQMSKKWNNSVFAVPFLEVVQRDHLNPCWTNGKQLSRYAKLQSRLYACLVELSSLDGTQQKRKAMDEVVSSQLAIEDSFLAGSSAIALENEIDKFEFLVNRFVAEVVSSKSFDHSRYEAWETVPTMAATLFFIQPFLDSESDRFGVERLGSVAERLNDGDSSTWSQMVPLLGDLAKWQRKLIAKYSSKLAVGGLPQQQAVLDSLLRYPTAIAGAEFGTDASVGALRLNARQRLLRDAHKLVSSRIAAKLTEANNRSSYAGQFVSRESEDERKFWENWLGQIPQTKSTKENEAQQTCWFGTLKCAKKLVDREELELSSNHVTLGDQPASQDLVAALEQSRLVAGTTYQAIGATLPSELQARKNRQDAIWQAARVVNAFWALPRIGGDSYYAAAGKMLLPDSRREVVATQDVSLVRQRIGQLVRNQSQAFALGLSWKPELQKPTLRLEAPDGEASSLHWNGRLNIEASVIGEPLAGLGCLSFNHGEKRLAKPVSGLEEDSIQLPKDAYDFLRDKDFSLTFHFRGHQFAQNGEVPKAYTAHADIRSNGQTTVLVQTTQRAGNDRTFILDCSSSMVNPAQSEVAANNLTASILASSKLASAKVALLRILESMIDSRDRVSVVLYGHRVADGTVEQGTLRQTKYDAAFPFSANLRAAEDVEVILPLGRFSQADYLEVARRLEAVVPWGQTPLYLAIREAIESNIQATSGQDIIIISDGVNYQFNPAAGKNPTIDDVISVAQNHGARLHLVGFGVPADERRRTKEDYQSLAVRSGGSHELQVFDLAKLSETLGRFSAADNVLVTLPSGEVVAGQPNQPIALPTIHGANARMTVQYRDHRIDLFAEQGDAFVLQADSHGKLAVPALLTNAPQFETVVDREFRPTPIRVGVHRPVVKSGAVEWLVTLQSTDGQPITKPARLIVKIRPSKASSNLGRGDVEEAAYWFASDHFEPGYSWPVLRVRTDDWPTDASQATIETWLLESNADVTVATIPMELSQTDRPKALSINVPGLEVQHLVSGSELLLLFGNPQTSEAGARSALFLPRYTGAFNRPHSASQIVAREAIVSKLRFDAGLSAVPKKVTLEIDSLSKIVETAKHLKEPIVIPLDAPEASIPVSTTVNW